MAQVKIGTCSVTTGSASVTGVGTNWLTTVLTDQPNRPNPSFAIAGGSAVYTVASVESDTELTLTAPYGGDSVTGANYSITVDFTPNLGLSEINKGDQDWALHLTEGVIRKLDEVIPSISSGGSVDISGKEDKTNKDTDATLSANSDVKYPSQKAVKSYVNNLAALDNVLRYGARGDASYGTDGAITVGSNVFTSTATTFSSQDIGKVILIHAAGANSSTLQSTIAGITSSHVVTLSGNAVATVSGEEFVYGTDNTSVIQSLVDAADTLVGTKGDIRIPPGNRMKSIYFPAGAYIFGSSVNVTNKYNIKFYGTGATIVFGDIRAFYVTKPYLTYFDNLLFDGICYDQLYVAPTYSTAIYTKGIAAAYLYVTNCTFRRMKRAVYDDEAGTGLRTGVKYQIFNNFAYADDVKDSIAYEFAAIDSHLSHSWASGFEIGAKLVHGDWSINNCHFYDKGIFRVTGDVTSGSNVITNIVSGGALPGWGDSFDLIPPDEFIAVFDSFDYTKYFGQRHVRITSKDVVNHTITVDTPAILSGTAVEVRTAGQLKALQLDVATDVILRDNEFDNSEDAIISITNGTTQFICDGNIFIKSKWPSPIIHFNFPSSAGISESIISNNRGVLGYDKATPFVTYTNLDTTAVTNFKVVNNYGISDRPVSLYQSEDGVVDENGVLGVEGLNIGPDIDATLTVPEVKLRGSAEDDSLQSDFVVADSTATPGFRGSVRGVRARGSLLAPTAPVVDDLVFSIIGGIYDGSTIRNTADINFTVDGSVSSNIAPQRISFRTRTGGAGAYLERLTVKNDGKIGIGTTSPSELLDVNGTIKAVSITDGSTTKTLTDLLAGSPVGGAATQVQINAGDNTLYADGDFKFNAGPTATGTKGVYLGATNNTVFGVYAPATYGGRTIVFGVDTNAGYSYFGDSSAAAIPSSGALRVIGDINITGDFKKNGTVVSGGSVTSVTGASGISGTVTTSGNLTNDLITGKSGGQTLAFDTASGATTGKLTSTTHATKGKYFLNSAGTMTVDEANVRFGVGTATPLVAVEAKGSNLMSRDIANTNVGGGGVDLLHNNDDVGSIPSVNDLLGSLAFGYLEGSTIRRVAGVSGIPDNTLGAGSTGRYGALIFKTSNAGAPAEKMRISSTGNIVLGSQSALATNATDGFTYIPTCAGTPSGVPTDYTGKSAMVHDTTGNKLWIYNHVTDTWKSTTLA